MPSVITTRNARTAKGKRDPPPQASIADFGRVSKVQSTRKEAKIETPLESTEAVLPLKKRKVQCDAEPAPNSTATKKPRLECEARIIKTPATPSRWSKIGTATPFNSATPSTPSSKRRLGSEAANKTSNRPGCDIAEPECLLEHLYLETPAAKRAERAERAKTSTGRDAAWNSWKLPQELADLLNLNAALLKTLAIQYAHNGRIIPLNLSETTANVTQAWGKRKVTVDDIRKCIGILGRASVHTPFFLSDYGRGKVCLELRSEASYPLGEDQLSMDFEAGLRALWAACQAKDNIGVFIETLPNCPIKDRSSLYPTLTKGQQRLNELKSGQAKKQAAAAQPKQAPNADGSRMSLLDRIRRKEEQAAQSQGPTEAELQRRAALQRSGDVAACIGMLSLATAGGQARISFSMAGLMVKLKDSMRIPISKEDGVCCVRLLANEIAPQWMRLVTIGGKENVVVQTNLQPSTRALLERVKSLE